MEANLSVCVSAMDEHVEHNAKQDGATLRQLAPINAGDIFEAACQVPWIWLDSKHVVEEVGDLSVRFGGGISVGLDAPIWKKTVVRATTPAGTSPTEAQVEGGASSIENVKALKDWYATVVRTARAESDAPPAESGAPSAARAESGTPAGNSEALKKWYAKRSRYNITIRITEGCGDRGQDQINGEYEALKKAHAALSDTEKQTHTMPKCHRCSNDGMGGTASGFAAFGQTFSR